MEPLSESFIQRWRYDRTLDSNFLGDQQPPSSLVLLKRGADRKYAPNRYTGIGGKIESGEEVGAGAVRELREETGIADIPLIEFGRLVMNGDRPTVESKVIHYFFGLDGRRQLPESNEGTLERVPIAEIMSRDWIPSTKIFVQQWARRSWSTLQLFTVVMDYDYNHHRPRSMKIEEGLHL